MNFALSIPCFSRSCFFKLLLPEIRKIVLGKITFTYVASKIVFIRKYLLCGHFLIVLAHTTASAKVGSVF